MVKCRVCKQRIVIYSSNDGALHILDYPRKGVTEAHLCGGYEEMLSKFMCKKVGVENGEVV